MKQMTTRDLTLAALFVAVTAVLAQVVVPMPLVPFNLSVLAVFLCGNLLEKKTAALSMVCYLLLGAVGVPVFAQFTAGPSVLFGVTGGYLVAYPITAWLTAWLIEKWAGDSFLRRMAAMILALLPLYLLGTVWFALYLHKGFVEAAMGACVPFIPFDLSKGVVAGYTSLALQKRMKGRRAVGA